MLDAIGERVKSPIEKYIEHKTVHNEHRISHMHTTQYSRYVEIALTGESTTSRRKPKIKTSSKKKWYRALTMIIRRVPDYIKK